MDDGELDVFGAAGSDNDLDIAFPIARATEEHRMNLLLVNEGDEFGSQYEGSVGEDDLFGSESEGRDSDDLFGSEFEGHDSGKVMQQQEHSLDEVSRQDNPQGVPCRYGKQLCCYYMQGRCHFRRGECWFSHDVQPIHKPWHFQPCQFGEDCLRGHWVALLASTLSLASVGVSAKVFSQPLIRQRICVFLKPRILPASVAAGVKWRAPEIEGPLQIPARDAFEVAVMEFLERPTTDLSLLRWSDVCAYFRDEFGELQVEHKSKVVNCLERFFSRQKAAPQKVFSTVADVKALIVEHVRGGVDCGYGLHLDGTLEALEDEVKSESTGPQDDATKSRWRQWIIDESIRQDCGVVV